MKVKDATRFSTAPNKKSGDRNLDLQVQTIKPVKLASPKTAKPPKKGK